VRLLLRADDLQAATDDVTDALAVAIADAHLIRSA